MSTNMENLSAVKKLTSENINNNIDDKINFNFRFIEFDDMVSLIMDTCEITHRDICDFSYSIANNAGLLENKQFLNLTKRFEEDVGFVCLDAISVAVDMDGKIGIPIEDGISDIIKKITQAKIFDISDVFVRRVCSLIAIKKLGKVY